MDSLSRSVIIQNGSPQECDSWAACEIIRLREEVARLRKDKKRLDWLQDGSAPVNDVLSHFMYCEHVNLRKEIDSARKKA